MADGYDDPTREDERMRGEDDCTRGRERVWSKEGLLLERKR